MRSSVLLSAAALCGLSLAHFEVKYPDTIGFKDDDEDKSPCGGFTPDLSKDKLVDFHVGGEAIALRSTHQQGNWLFRVTLDEEASGGWEQVYPIVQQSGLGDFCQPHVTVPEKYAGKKGWVNVVSSAVDGLLYQVSLSYKPNYMANRISALLPISSRARPMHPASARTHLRSKHTLSTTTSFLLLWMADQIRRNRQLARPPALAQRRLPQKLKIRVRRRNLGQPTALA